MGKKRQGGKRRETMTAVFMIAPEILLMLVFIFIPIVHACYISLFDWNALGAKSFVGISNYMKMLKDSTFKTAF